ncbi:hypothetical protein BCV70DRAFT_20348 [Testicularia cyperi]|uniref:Uncharacterized protein n=1 Tax=Testicularia cyperi TaxID=1882483 RepID=A0A317Y0E0_9BASI|nr:hypothetical protein BCV70DRAFT_20348 [Testicularia cyperi]
MTRLHGLMRYILQQARGGVIRLIRQMGGSQPQSGPDTWRVTAFILMGACFGSLAVGYIVPLLYPFGRIAHHNCGIYTATLELPKYRSQVHSWRRRCLCSARVGVNEGPL